MGPSFNEQFEQHGAWRREIRPATQQLGEWMSAHELMDAAVQERLQRLEGQLRSDRIMVAFVAEFSRRFKSELINAIFFADYGGASCRPVPGAPPCAPPSWATTPGAPLPAPSAH